MELISGKLKRVTIICTVIGGILGILCGLLSIIVWSNTPELRGALRISLVLPLYFCFFGIFIGCCFPLCIGVTNRIMHSQNTLIKIISNLIAIIVAIGISYLFVIVLDYLVGLLTKGYPSFRLIILRLLSLLVKGEVIY